MALSISSGDKGAAFASRDNPKPSWIKAEKATQVVDTTGAGDAFVGSAAFYLAYYPKLDLKEVVRRSCNIATISVQKSGTQASFPRAKELDTKEFFS